MKLASLGVALLSASAACGVNPDVSRHARTRVISLVPAATEMIVQLGADSVLVGRAYEDSIGHSNALPVAGRVLEPNLDSIIALRPDVVIASPEVTSSLSRLRDYGIRVITMRFERVAHVEQNARTIGTLIDAPRQTDSLVTKFNTELRDVRTKTSSLERPSVMWVLDTEPLWTAGPNTFVDDMIRIAGGRNAFGDLASQWNNITLEAVVERQPDVIVVAQTDRRWRGLRGVDKARVVFVDPQLFGTAGANIARAARVLAKLLHPNDSIHV